MHLTHQLFNSEEALVRLGQTRQQGCLIIASVEGCTRLFVENGSVVSAYGEKNSGQKALELAFSFADSSHTWIPEAKPATKTMDVNIAMYSLKHSIARDIHVAKTGKLHTAGEKPPQKMIKKNSHVYYLVAENRPNEKIVISKGTVILGRDESCDILLPSVEVSRRHCLMQIIARGLSFRDLDSTNGIRVNGFPASDGIINPGDKLHFGSYGMEVFQES